MDNIQDTIKELRDMDELSDGSSLFHCLHPTAKLIVTILYILLVVSFHKYSLSRMIVMILFPVFFYQMAGIPVRMCFYRLRMILPLILAVGIFNPLFDRQPVLLLGSFVVTAGMISMLTLMLKGILCLMMSFLLIATTSMDAICLSLRQMHCPSMIVTLLLLTYRYVFLMAEEVGIMTEAYMLRAPGQKGIHYKAWGSFLGQLLLRSMDKAEELYCAMKLRGFKGEFYYADTLRFTGRDGAFMAVSVLLMLLCRVGNIAGSIGSLFIH